MPIFEIIGLIAAPVLALALKQDLEDLEERRRQERLASSNERQKLNPKATREVSPEEKERRRLKRQENRQRRERERQAQEAARQASLEAKQQEAATAAAEAAKVATEEQARTEQALVQWKNDRLNKMPTPAQTAEAVEEGNNVQSHTGRHIHVIALVSPTGVVLEWKVHNGSLSVPRVTGTRNDHIMFSECAFVGRHAARLAPGQYFFAFEVNQVGQHSSGIDLFFEIFIPVGSPARSADHFKSAVDAKAQEFISRANTVAQAKKAVSEALDATTDDPDEITAEMSVFEGELDEIKNVERTEE